MPAENTINANSDFPGPPLAPRPLLFLPSPLVIAVGGMRGIDYACERNTANRRIFLLVVGLYPPIRIGIALRGVVTDESSKYRSSQTLVG